MEGSNTNDSALVPSPQQPQRQKTGAAPAAPHREKERVNVCDKTHASTIAGMERPSFNSNVAEWNSTAGGRPGPEQDYVRCAEGGQGGVPCSNNMTSKRDLRFFTEHKQYGAKDKSARTRPGSMRHGCKNTSSTSNGKPRKKSSLERKFERRSTQREAAAAKSANDEESSVEFDIINESPPLAPISRQKSPFDTRLIRPSNSRDGARREGKADDAEERDLDSQSEIDPNDPAANDKVDALHNSFDTDSQPSKLKELNQSILADKQAALELLQPPAGKSRQQSHPPDAEDAHIAGKEIQVIPSQVGAMSQIDMYQSQMGGLSQLSTNEDELGDGVTLSQMKLEGTKARLDDDRGNEKTEPAEDQLEVARQECQNDIDFGGNNDREKLPFEDSRLSSIRPDSSRFELINSDKADGCDHGDLELSRMERGERKCTNSPDRNDPVQPTNVFDGTTGADTTGGQMGLANIKTHDVQAKLMKQYRERNQSKKKEGGARRRPKNNARSAALEAQREVEKEATKEAFKRKLGTTRKQGGLRNATAAALEEFAETRTIGTEPQKVGRKIDVGTSVVPKQDLQCTKRKGGAVKNHDAFDDNAGYSFDLDDGAPHAAVGSLDKHADDVTKRKSKGERQSDIESIEGTAREQSEPLLSSSLPTSEKSESLLSSAVPFEDSRLSAIPRSNSQYSKHSIVEPMVAESGGKAIASGNSEARSSRTNHPVKKASSHSPSGECGGDGDRTDTDGGKQTEPADEDSRRRNEAVLAIHAEIDNLLKLLRGMSQVAILG
ncbi:hypothetical protein THAOC_33713 [Thalassiosira oceanica]|uniref:Uncharacterized protein n=1 Tax=Thalassiosira oceanica TaxID=159749 RepID=K0R6I7_THAOC|nr:hypothetical protein THAOC_33713 [Thalassiosira oceanica]|eukprot:EJK47559.1 hypothetical protein THAOC_33713 [Thalassiosira oceanica]